VAVAVGSGKIPSVDPAIKKDADDVLHDPDAYFARQRELYTREAQEYVGQELSRAFSMRRRTGLWSLLARLSHG
jgi:hypothetical protein